VDRLVCASAEATSEFLKAPRVIRDRQKHALLTRNDEQASMLGRLLDGPYLVTASLHETRARSAKYLSRGGTVKSLLLRGLVLLPLFRLIGGCAATA
jgi:hypothetical protein